MKMYLIFLFALIPALAFGAKITDDNLQLGKPGSSSAKKLQFSTTNNAELSIDHTTEELSYSKEKLKMGAGTNVDKTITFDKGGSNPQIKYNSATGKLEFSNDSATFKPFGSGTGSGGATGGINILTNQGFEDGVTAGWMATPAAAVAVYTAAVDGNAQYATWDATTSGNTFKSSLVTKPDNISGGCMADVMYNGGDANLALKVLNASATPIASQTLEAVTTWQKSPTLTFPCASGMQLSLEATANAASISLDDAYLGSNKGFFPIDKLEECSAVISNNGTAAIVSQQGNCISSVSRTSAGRVVVNFVPGYFTVAPAVQCQIASNVAQRCSLDGAATTTQAIPYTINSSHVNTDADFSISINKQGADSTAKPLTGYAATTTHSRAQVLSARILNSGSSSINTQSGNWINSTSRISAGIVELQFVPGVFSVIPSCGCTPQDAAGNAQTCHVVDTGYTPGPTVLRFQTQESSVGVFQDKNFEVVCGKQGVDFTNALNVQNNPYLLNQVETTYSAGIRTESCRIANSGTPTLGTYCSSWVNSITDINVGRMTVNLKSGTFSSSPTCTVSGTTYANVAAATLTALPGLNTVDISTYDPFATPPSHYLDIDLTLICTGAR